MKSRYKLLPLLVLPFLFTNPAGFSQPMSSCGCKPPAPPSNSICPAPTGGAAAIAPAASRDLGKQTAGDYIFQLKSEPAKGWYAPTAGQLVWTAPTAGTNAHIEVVLTNSIDQRALPNAGVRLSIFGPNNTLIESKPMIMLWSPDGYHYGNNFTIPKAANYSVRVDVLTPPMFARHDKQLGNRFFSAARVTFNNAALRPEGMSQQ